MKEENNGISASTSIHVPHISELTEDVWSPMLLDGDLLSD